MVPREDVTFIQAMNFTLQTQHVHKKGWIPPNIYIDSIKKDIPICFSFDMLGADSGILRIDLVTGCRETNWAVTRR